MELPGDVLVGEAREVAARVQADAAEQIGRAVDAGEVSGGARYVDGGSAVEAVLGVCATRTGSERGDCRVQQRAFEGRADDTRPETAGGEAGLAE